MKKVLSLVLFLAILLSSTVAFAAQSSTSFTDLPTDHWAYQAVMHMVDKGILEGFGDGTFRPNDPVTRAQFAKILVLSLGLPIDYSGEKTFADVPSSDWSYQYVEAAQKYLTGYKNQADGKFYFKGDNVAVREDMAVAVVVARGLSTQSADLTVLNSFSDVSSMSPSIRKYIAIAVTNGIMDGYGNGLFGPQNTLTRAEAAELMYKSGILSGDKVAMGNGGDQSSNVFNLKTVKVGDKVAGMTVADIQPEIYNDGKDGIGSIKFSGQVTISGTYKVVHEEMYGEDILYLKLDNDSIKQMPMFAGEQSLEISTEMDNSTIMKSFGEAGTAGEFKIILNSYYISFMSETYDNVGITKIIELTKDSGALAPTVVSTSPSDGTESSELPNIKITFSENVVRSVESSNSDVILYDYLGNKVPFSEDYTNLAQDGKDLYITPTKLLNPQTIYTVNVLSAFKNSAGILNKPYTFKFTPHGPLAIQGVAHTTPTDGEIGVDLNPYISILFNESIVGLESSDINMFDSNGQIVRISYTVMSNAIKIKTLSRLKPNTKYTLKVSSGIKDEFGNAMSVPYSFSFTTKVADTTAIAKIQSVKLSIVPQTTGNDKYVAIVTLQKSSEDTVKVEGYSELYVASMDQYLKENDTQTIEDTNGTVKISGIIPAGLAYSKIRVKARIVSISKGLFDGNVVTSNELKINSVDNIAPTVVSTTPTDGTIDVDVNAPIDIVYSKTIQKPDYNPSDINVTYNSGTNNFLTTVATKIEGSNKNILRLVPNYGLRPSTTYIVKITAGTVKDAFGDPTTEPYIFSFTTKAEKEAELVPPNNFKASLTSDKKVLLSWDIVPNSNPNYNQGYTILRDGKFLTMIKDSSKNSFIDNTVEADKTYTYVIDFYFGAFDSKPSNSVTISVGIDNTKPTATSTTSTSETVKPIITVGNVSGADGQNVAVNVSVTANSQICGGLFDLVYDSNKLELVSVVPGELVKEMMPTVNEHYAANKIRAVWAGLNPITQTGKLWIVTFKIKDGATGTATVNIENPDLCDFNLKTVECQMVNGNITIVQ